ncbi:MAG: YHS domain-containing (seleno)protein [Pseudomonadota bacterium]
MTHFHSLLFAAMFFMPQLSFAQTTPAIGGYSPVAYFTQGKPVLGDPAFAASHDEKTYYFASAEEVALFEEDPEKYAPRYPLCAFSLALGQKMPLDPTNFQIIGGHLLLFHRSDEVDGLFAFKESGLTDKELVERADKSFKLITF